MKKPKIKSINEIKLDLYKSSKLALIDLEPNKVKKILKKIWFYVTYGFKWLYEECKDWRMLVVFLLVNAFFSSPCWFCLSLGLITKNQVLLTIGTTWQLIYMLPFWLPICIVVSINIYKIIKRSK